MIGVVARFCVQLTSTCVRRKHLLAIRNSGGKVNRKITIATALGTVRVLQPSLLPEHGGSLCLEKGWAESILRRMNFVKRKGTKAARKVPADVDEIKQAYIERIRQKVNANNIPSELVLNLDETGLPIVPVSNWTLDVEGASQVALTGMEDKRQITAVLTCTASGVLLPPQLLYRGTTDRCHPKTIDFPSGWDIFHSENHSSTHHTVKRLIDTILLPYVTKVKLDLGLPEEQRALLILDIFKAHRTPDVLDRLREAGFLLEFVPANCTSQLQPLDVSLNGPYKEALSSEFTDWYAGLVSAAVQKDPDNFELAAASVNPELKLSIMKPLHAGWVMNCHAKLSAKADLIIDGWRRSGIEPALHTSGPLQDSATQQPQSTDEMLAGNVQSVRRIGSLQVVERTFAEEDFTEYLLEKKLSQSWIDGRNGSNACTVIASVMAKAVLQGIARWNMDGGPDLSLFSAFVASIREGNAHYDSSAGAKSAGLLGVYDIFSLWPSLRLKAVPGQDFGFRTSATMVEKLSAHLSEVVTRNGSFVGVLVVAPYSVCIAFKGGRLAIFDSHGHTGLGPLVSLSAPGASPRKLAMFLSSFFDRHFGVPISDAHLCSLQLY